MTVCELCAFCVDRRPRYGVARAAIARYAYGLRRSAMSWKKSMLFATLACAALAAVYAAAPYAQQAAPFDVIVRGGHIVDGAGNPWVAGDVGIRNGRIAGVGSLANAQAARVIDAAGRIVAPGFIDLHTHSDVTVLADPLAEIKVRQD